MKTIIIQCISDLWFPVFIGSFGATCVAMFCREAARANRLRSKRKAAERERAEMAAQRIRQFRVDNRESRTAFPKRA